jgi:DNA-binding NarL/FixJ family response regulator
MVELPEHLERVLQGAAHGESAAETAERLGLSHWTVNSYRHQVITRLDAKNMTNAVFLAYSNHGK